MLSRHLSISFFFFNDTATTEIYTLSLHDALPIYYVYSVAKPDGLTLGTPNQSVYMGQVVGDKEARFDVQKLNWIGSPDRNTTRSEEHTSELQSQSNLVCRLLLEKKKRSTRRFCSC